MKKLITLLLTMTLLLSMTACRRKKPADTPADSTGNTTGAAEGTSKGLAGTMEENVNKIMQANPVAFMGGMMPVDLQDTSEEGLWSLKSFTGLDNADKISDIAVYEPMTGSQAFSLVMARVKNSADTRTVAQQMKDNINPAKWICVRADQVLAAGFGDTVMFIMLDSTLGITAQAYVDAFANLCGGKVDFTI